MKTNVSLKAVNGELNGEIILTWNAVKKASGYTVEICSHNIRKVWEQVDFVTKPKCIISGMQKGKTYMFRVSAVESENPDIWSDIIKKEL